MRGESVYILNLSNEVGGGDISESIDGFKDLKIFKAGGFVFFYEEPFNSFKLLLQTKEPSYLGFEGLLIYGRFDADGISVSLKDLRDRERCFSSSSFFGNGLERLCFSLQESLFRGEREKKFERGMSKGVYNSEELWEKDVEEPFGFVLQGCNLFSDSFPLPCQDSKISKGLLSKRELFHTYPHELSHSKGVFSICFCFSQRELREFRDEERIKDDASEAAGVKEGKQRDIIATSGLHTNCKPLEVSRFRTDGREEGLEALRRHRKGDGLILFD